MTFDELQKKVENLTDQNPFLIHNGYVIEKGKWNCYWIGFEQFDTAEEAVDYLARNNNL